MNQAPGNRARFETWAAGCLIALVTALTYGILIPKLGFYRDDWYMLWSGQSKDGLSAIIRLFQTDRPLIGWTFAFFFKFLGTNVILWHISALLLKILTGLLVLWTLRLVWPSRKIETTCAALLFVLYPGFYQQPVAATFIIDLLGLNAFFISLILMIYVVRASVSLSKPKPGIIPLITATLIAVAMGLINLGLYEGTIGMEVLRWVLIWQLLSMKETVLLPETKPTAGDSKKSELQKRNFVLFRRLLLHLAPYFLMLAGFLFWRLFIFKSVRRATNIDVLLADYASSPLYSIFQIFISYIKDLFETIVLAWFIPFYQFTSEGRFNSFLSSLGLALLVLLLAGAYIYWFQKQDKQETESQNHGFILAGLAGVLIPTGVIVLLGRNVIFSIQWDRYTTQSMLGVALLSTGIIFTSLRWRARWTTLATLIILAVMTQYHSAAAYAKFWDYERGVIWQLSWRAPGFQPGTTVIVSLPEGSRLAEEYEIWGPINMAYFPRQEMQVSGQVPTDDMILDLKAGTLEKRLMRNLNIVRDYSKPLIVSLPSGSSCVHVLDGKRIALPFFESGRIKEMASYSNTSLIDLSATPATPSQSTFGQEPAHNWCYYYQKIELALQSENFSEAVRLADEASQKGLNPTDQSEWVPVIEAYTSVGNTKKAAATAKKIDKNLRKYLCLQRPIIAQPAASDVAITTPIPALKNTEQVNKIICAGS